LKDAKALCHFNNKEAKMGIVIYRHDIKQPKKRNSFERSLELTIKSVILFTIPLFFSAAVSWAWYRYLYIPKIFFDDKMESIITCAWIPTFAILYALVTSKVLDTVWAEYKAMREARKIGTRGVVDFVKLRDEKISPLIYMVILTLSASIMIAFMVIKYPCVLGGFCTVASTSYLFGLIIYIIGEIDNPCGGLWFIHRMPNKWLTIDTAKFHERLAKATDKQIRQPAFLKTAIDECQIK
jgi:hypothetical protein